jgi:hypothetical protein
LNDAGVPIDQIPETARVAWLRLRGELQTILGDNLVALWGYGGTTAADRPTPHGDLDTYAVVARPLDDETAQRIEDAHDRIAEAEGVVWDAGYVLADDARRPESPRHAYREGRRDTAWAINRAHWLADRYVHLAGLQPDEIVPAPSWAELEVDLSRELEHVERHIVEGDTDPYEAAYAILNGSRILHALETGSVAISKRSAGAWALERLPERWHPPIRAAFRAHDGKSTPEDEALLADTMAPFVGMVRERLPALEADSDEARPRWSGY